MRHPHAADIAVFGVYALSIAASLTLLPSSSDTLYVDADGEEYAYSLSEDGIYPFEGPLGITEIEIKDGEARIISSPCPNGTCMRSAWTGMLCCLPNRVIATTSGGEGEVDAISG